jgi:hypothetical protein
MAGSARFYDAQSKRFAIAARQANIIIGLYQF